jgi:hypothetical protein
MSFFRRHRLVPQFDMTAEFDIEGLEVVSVERQLDGQTVICRKAKDGFDTIEWYAFTTDEKHLEFCDRLKRKLKSKNAI